MRTAHVFRLSMAHPGDLSALDNLIEAGTIEASDVAAIIGKTEGNGGVNDFTRGYFTQTLMALLWRHLDRPASQLVRQIPCVLSGGTEGVMSPHYNLFCISEREAPPRNVIAQGQKCGPLMPRGNTCAGEDTAISNLRRIRHNRGISQEGLAHEAGVDRASVSRIERAVTYVGLEIIGKFAEVLRVDPAEFFKAPARTHRKS